MKGRPRDDDTTARERVERDEEEERERWANVACASVQGLSDVSRRLIVSVYYIITIREARWGARNTLKSKYVTESLRGN